MNIAPHTLKTTRLTVQPALIAAYAELTNDFNPIHLDAEFAAQTPMGGVIAHGTMSIGLIWQSLQRSLGAGAFAGARLDVRFVKPVRLGETLIAGGRERFGDPGVYDVWVRVEPGGSSEAGDRIVGTVHVPLPPHPHESNDGN
jgi:hydroxyacyl-ACP dehydratase HTD2-like protein with hotdog domain